MPAINISDIDTDSSVQVRAKIDPDTVAEYTANIEAKKAPLPPIVVFGPDSRGKYFLSEGWHRLEANRRAGRTTIMATIKDGGWKDALEHALGSNAAHGLKRTNADKRRAVELALKHWPTWSNRAVADKCGMDESTVRDLRPTCGIPAPETVTGKDGKQYPAHPPSRPPMSQPQPPQENEEDEQENAEPPKDDWMPPKAPDDAEEPEEVPPVEKGQLPKDTKGRLVPPCCVPMWERRREILDVLNTISDLRTMFQNADDDRDPLWHGKEKGLSLVNFGSLQAHLNQIYADVKAALPIRVCPVCQGIGCRHCAGLGIISKFRLSLIPREKRG